MIAAELNSFLVGLIDCIPSEVTKTFQWNLAATLTLGVLSSTEGWESDNT